MKKPDQTDARKSATPVSPKQTTLRPTFIMTNPNGLHAQPCAMLDKALQPFTCEVKVEHDGASTDGRSLFGLLGLAVGCESKITFVMSGDDATQAMAAVQQLFDTKFEVAYAPPNKSSTGK
jgi:phosphocarrier protein HPr